MKKSWEITQEKVHAAIDRIVEVARPEKLILFGSYVSGEHTEDSDLDVLVISDDTVQNTRAESVRIRRALRGISMPMDILVVRRGRFNELADAPGLIFREIVKHGMVVYESGRNSRAPASPMEWIVHAESDLQMAKLGYDDIASLTENSHDFL